MSNQKQLITLWIDWYDYGNCILQEFSIEYETTDLSDAYRKLDLISKEKVNQGLKEFENFSIVQNPPQRRSALEDVNKDNRVIKKVRRKIGDGSGCNYIYCDFDIIEVPAEAKVDEALFNLKNCGKEINSFFTYSYKQSPQKTPSEKRFIGLKELAKAKLSLGGINEKKTIDRYSEINVQKKKQRTENE